MYEKSLFIIWFPVPDGCASSKHSGLTVVNRSEQEKDDLYRKDRMYGNSGLHMTNLWRDSLVSGQDTLLINHSPLLDFEGITRAILRDNETAAAPLKKNKKGYWIRSLISPYNCDREYTAIWYIKKNKLYLGKVTPREFDFPEHAGQAFEGSQQIDQRKINKRIENATGWKYENGLIFADWINGSLSENIGGERDSEKRTLVIINSPKEFKMEIKKGIVQGIRISDCRE